MPLKPLDGPDNPHNPGLAVANDPSPELAAESMSAAAAATTESTAEETSSDR